MKPTIFLTTRYESSRLQLKHLLDIGDSTATDFLIERLKKTGLDIIMITPSTRENSQYMKSIAQYHNIGYFAGDINNIIARHYACALTNGIESVINIDGDDVLSVPDVILKVANVLENIDADVVTTQGLPLGLNTFGYRTNVLKNINFNNDTGWGAKILDNDKVILEYKNIKDYRLTMDYQEDFSLIKNIIENCKNNDKLENIIAYLDANPEVANMNQARVKEYWDRYNQKKGE